MQGINNESAFRSDIRINVGKSPFKEKPPEMDSRPSRYHESLLAKIAHFLGAILQMFLIALPKDLCRWLRLKRKCVRTQTVVITGGASGIGQLLAELFADTDKLGARVAIIDSNFEGAERVVQGIVKAGGSARAWECDIVNGEDMRKCAEEIHKHFGRVDIVICNAAILYFAYTLELKDHEIQRAMNVNLLGTINTIRAFLPEMEAKGSGQIVAISSIAGFFGETFGMAYCPTKFAVRGAMDCLRMELRDRGHENIVCTTICPFFVRTPMILDKGIRPVSRWIPFMSVSRCANLIVDAVLKEKVLAFMPTWLSLLTMLNGLFSLNMQRVARDFINCRYEEIEEESEENVPIQINSQIQSNEKLAQPPPAEGEATKNPTKPKIGTEAKMKGGGRGQMRDHFQFSGIFWWVLIPPAMLLTFLTFYNPDLLNVPWLSLLGQFAYNLGTDHPQLVLWINIFAWLLHFGEAIFALYLADVLRLNHKSSFLWFFQTITLGYPSLRLLLKLWRKERHNH